MSFLYEKLQYYYAPSLDKPMLKISVDLSKIMEQPHLAKLIKLANDHDIDMGIVGGAVRDILMTEDPNNLSVGDIDVVMFNVPKELLIKELGAAEVTSKSSTTVYRYHNIDISVRSNMLSFTDDRDFSINSLFLIIPRSGTQTNTHFIIDLCNGVEDLENRVINFPSKYSTFEKDPIRILRALRFVATKGFTLSPAVSTAMRKVAHLLEPDLFGERIRDEIFKVIRAGGGKALAKFLTLLDEYYQLSNLFPYIKLMQNLPQPKKYHPEGDVFVHTLKALESTDSKDIAVVLSVLFHDIGKVATYRNNDHSGKISFIEHEVTGVSVFAKTTKHFKFSNKLISTIQFCIYNHMRMHEFLKMRKSKRVFLMQSRYFDVLRQVHIADMLGSVLPSENYIEELNDEIAVLDKVLIPDVGNEGMRKFVLNISAADIIEMCPERFKLGDGEIDKSYLKLITPTLNHVQAMILDGKLKNEGLLLIKESINYMKNKLPEKPL